MNTLSAILWNPDIEIFSIFGISIRYYSVLFVTGLSLAYWVIYKLYQDQKIPYEKFDSLFVYCLLGIVIGARLGHCLFYEPGYWLSHPEVPDCTRQYSHRHPAGRLFYPFR